ncbi:alpha/beta hydrolase [Rossellomorea vietnamensis]|uniref:alpha/beta hydrolase n=1 Tax=Rossellomorea TaxID=2837508 RepID=UPI001CC9C71F|nr:MULTISPECIES: alpha/beta fold hydrolase [Rossellomorea]MCA0147725.1 alpha/beta hydrolase [Rossellomorea vietnamensis]UTE76231.1 alpha/beta hydrolase [Rossellomorea sp. KS-H15a]
MRKKWAILGGTLSSIGLLGVYITNRFMYLPKKGDDFIRARETESTRLIEEEYDSLPKEEVLISSQYGYDIKAVFVKPHSHNKFMIFSHGVTENKWNSIKYMNLFIKQGFNAVIYDHRRHGESGGKTTSYGYFEKYDLKAVVDELIRREGDDVFFGIHGESMGAATLLLYAGSVEDRADFYIADCPFSDFGEQLAYRMSAEVKMPAKFLLPLVDGTLKLRQGYTLKDLSPISVVQNIQKPVLFIHSKNDDFILPQMTKDLFEKKQGPKELFLDFSGTHAQSYNDNPEEYEELIQRFLEQFVLKGKDVVS